MKYTKEKFFEQVKCNVEEKMKGYKVNLTPVIKPGNLTLHAITISDNSEQTMSPSIYIDNYYEEFIRNQISVDSLSTQIINVWNEHYNDIQFDFNSLKGCRNIFLRVLNKKLSAEYLTDKVTREIENTNFVFVPYMEIEKDRTITINKQFLDFLDMKVDEVFEIAFKNSKLLKKACSKSIVDTITDIGIKEIEETNESDFFMQVITNEEKYFGSSVIFYTDVLRNLSEKWNADLVIIPSSIHEVIAMPYNEHFVLEEVQNMISHTNFNFVSQDEILDNIPYLYKRNTDSIERF